MALGLPAQGITRHRHPAVADQPPDGAKPDFSVLLGPDYAGKSTVISALAADGVRCVSYDREFVEPEWPLVNDLRDQFIGTALQHLDAPYSPDFIVTLLQASVVYLRDQAVAACAGRPVVVDSYYYKILAKCVLTGSANDTLFGWWRSFPQPRQVIYLDVDPATAWRRSGEGEHLNPFEHYGRRPTWAGFHQFQTDLGRLMFEEIGAIPVTVIGETDSAAQISDALSHIRRRGNAVTVDS